MGRRTPLYSEYSGSGQIVEFAGFELPMSFEGIIPEAMATRNRCSAFDVSHMGRVIVSGQDSAVALDRIMTPHISVLEPMQAKYSLMLNAKGGVLDDLIVYSLAAKKYMIVWNAANRAKDISWLRLNSNDLNVEIDDISDATFMLAVQGPLSIRAMGRISEVDLSALRRYRAVECRVAGAECIVSRTGYTGEDGFEIISHDLGRAGTIWHSVGEEGAAFAGLGARDVLRIEAGMCLYGKELCESRDPFQAGLGFAIAMQKPNFVGKGALAVLAGRGSGEHLIGIRMNGRSIPREGQRILLDGREIGTVTSGTFSPTIGSPVAMGYVSDKLPPGVRIAVDIRGRLADGVVAAMPFYNAAEYGWKRQAR